MENFMTLIIYIALLIGPVALGLLVYYKKIKRKQAYLIVNTLLSLLFGSLVIYAETSDPPRTIFMLSVSEWLISIGVAIFSWIPMFLVTRLFMRD